MSSQQQQQQSEQTAVIRARKAPSLRRRDGLIQYACDRTSQNGEDGIIERIFQLVPPQQNAVSISNGGSIGNRTRFCVDVGAWDGIHLSNTRSLLCNNDQSWCGMLIEADPQKFKQLAVLYADTNNILLNRIISVIDPKNNSNSLHQILEHRFSAGDFCAVDTEISIAPQLNIDFLCIDIDGPDYFVLSDLFTFSQFRPIVICIEFNPTMPDDLIYIPPRSDSQRHVSTFLQITDVFLHCTLM